MTKDLVLPDPEHTALPAMRAKCREIFDRRDELVGHLNIRIANDYRRQAAAIEQFVGNREGRDDARRASRILECAVGAALGSGHIGINQFKGSLASEPSAIPAVDRHRFRLMYQHRELWEPVLLQRGLSRAQVLRLIQLRQPSADVSEQPATIAQADCREWLDEQPECDLLLTDPPYATDVEDVDRFARNWLPIALQKVRPTGRAYVCIGAYPRELEAYLRADHADMTLAQVLVWTYRNTLGPAPTHDYKQNWQAVLYFRGAASGPLHAPSLVEQFSVQDLNAPDGRLGDRFHAWQKPGALGERFIRHATNPGDLVLDPFAGTGTFLLAAAKLGRAASGCDRDPAQVAICVDRGCVRA